LDNAREREGKAWEISRVCWQHFGPLILFDCLTNRYFKKKKGNHNAVFSGRQQFLLAKLRFAIPSWEYLSGDIAILFLIISLEP